MFNSKTKLQVYQRVKNQNIPTQASMEIHDPGRLTDIIGRAPIGTAEDVDLAVKAAQKAFLAWREISVDERVESVMSAAQILKESIPDLAPLLVREHGGLLKEAQSDFLGGFACLTYYSEIVSDFMRPEQSENEVSWISTEKNPKGVVAAIVPWNMPVVLTMMKLAPALMTGNTIVVKPSPNAPIALTLLLNRMASVLPDGVINVIHGGAEVGIALTRHPSVKKIAFTGGTITGKEVNLNASASFKGVTLELGGNDPAIILDDAHLEEIMPRLLKGIFTRSGQICCGIKRIYVPEQILTDFFDLLCQRVDKLQVGHGLDERATLGPVNNKHQYQFVLKLIEEAKSCGATVRELGSKLDPENWNNGYYILPQVVLDREHRTQLVHCEQFGPVIPITPYKTIEQSIQFANDTNYGLTSSIWSSDFERAVKVARKIEAGSTFINTQGQGSTTFGMPFGGIKNSGIGSEMSSVPTLSAYIDFHAMRYLK